MNAYDESGTGEIDYGPDDMDHGLGDLYADDRGHDRPATESEAHVEWHLNSGVPMGTPGCPQDACHPDEHEEFEGITTASDDPRHAQQVIDHIAHLSDEQIAEIRAALEQWEKAARLAEQAARRERADRFMRKNRENVGDDQSRNPLTGKQA